MTRFSALLEVDGVPVLAHLPNSGRLTELLTDGAPAWLIPKHGAARRTEWDLALVEYGGRLVSVDARLPNDLVFAALRARRIPELARYPHQRREAVVGASRFDFLLADGAERCLVEVKSVTLVLDGCALFPDAPTARGSRHLRELAELARRREGAAVLFVVQRADAATFAANEAADPLFAALLRSAAGAGVLVRAYRCSVNWTEIALKDEIPVLL